MIMNNILAQPGVGSEIYTLVSIYSERSLSVCFIGENGIECHSGIGGLEEGTYKIRPGLLITRQYASKNPASISGMVEHIGNIDSVEIYRVYGKVLIS